MRWACWNHRQSHRRLLPTTLSVTLAWIATATMRLWAIADIHVSFKSNREEFANLKAQGEADGLILAGDGAH